MTTHEPRLHQPTRATRAAQSTQPAQCEQPAQQEGPDSADGSEGPDGRRGWSRETVRELIRAVAPTPTRLLTDDQRDQLRRIVEARWQERACCASADPAAWYPGPGLMPVGQVTRICAACPVRRSCLAVALLWNEQGIWAGTNPGHRRSGYRLLQAGDSTPAVVQLLLTRATRATRDADATTSRDSRQTRVPHDRPEAA